MSQHSISIHVSDEHVIDSGNIFCSPELQVWVSHVVMSQHSLSVHVSDEHVIDPALNFCLPELQVWEEHVVVPPP